MNNDAPLGRPPHKPTAETRQKVIDLSCNGATQPQIGAYLGIDDKTLRLYYREELDKSKLDKRVILGNNLYSDALAGDKAAREFWLKCQGGWCPARAAEEKTIEQTFMENWIKTQMEKNA